MKPEMQVELIARMEESLSDPAFQHDLAEVRSKAILAAVGEPINPPKWRYEARQFARNSAAALYALEESSLQTPAAAQDHENRARQLALAWESLSKLSEGADQSTAALNAALAYELAGYQANASFLARELFPNIETIAEPDAITVVSAFLQRKLILARHFATKLIENQPDPATPLDTLAFRLGEILIVDALLHASRYFLTGITEPYDRALLLLREATDLFDNIAAPIHSNLTFGIRSILPLMQQRSIWNQLGDHVEESEIWNRYLTLLARGTARLSSRGVTEFWRSQIRVLQANILTSTDNIVVRLPTSGGKTRIAEVCIINALQSNENAKCVFVAPYRALAFEVEKTLGSLLVDLGYKVSSIVGSYETDEFESFMLESADVLIVTPEKLDLIVRVHPEIAERIKLIVLDEVHVVDDDSRGIKYEMLITRIKSKLEECRFLVMSAVVPDSTLEMFATWFTGSPENGITSRWRPTIQRIAKFEWRSEVGIIRFERDSDLPDLDSFVPGAILQRKYSYVNPETRRVNTRTFPSAEKGDTVAELAYVLSKQGPVLVFCPRRDRVESVAKTILNRAIGYRRLSGEPVHNHFGNSENTRSAELAREWLGEDHAATRCLSNGIAFHHGRLPNIVREAIEIDCREGRYKVVVATNTLAQGVNLPVRTVIIYDTVRDYRDRMESRITVRDYWNIVGRAGRAGEETEGLIIHIALNDADKFEFEHFKHPERIEPVDGALFRLLKRIAISRLPSGEVTLSVARLDPEILAMTVEEEIDSVESYEWDAIFNGSFVRTQVDAQRRDIAPLVQATQQVAEQIFQRAPDSNWRRIYSQTGLSSFSCDRLKTFVQDHEDEFQRLLRTASFDDLVPMNQLILNGSIQLPEAQTDSAFAGDTGEILDSWMQGAKINEIATIGVSDGESVEQLARHIEDLFGYRLPWIISGLFKISKALLSIGDEEISDYIRSYPAMVRHGLPDHIATWAMSAGITTRATAKDLAAGFARFPTNAQSHENFIEWLANLSDDSLREEFGIRGHALEDLKYKLNRMVRNPMLSPIRPLDDEFPRSADIVGVQYGTRKFAARRVRLGDDLDLKRDYENPVDSNAIAVHHAAGQIGFLPRSLAQRIAPDIDAGQSIVATATSVNPGEIPSVSALLSLG